jgi:hypothetical protein
VSSRARWYGAASSAPQCSHGLGIIDGCHTRGGGGFAGINGTLHGIGQAAASPRRARTSASATRRRTAADAHRGCVHRTRTARMAATLRSNGVMLAALVTPPSRHSATVNR